jgi:hypothetical protein
VKASVALVVIGVALAAAGCGGDDDEEATESRRPPKLVNATVDGERKLALEWGSWTRNRAGAYWARRDLANCSPIRQSDPPGTEPPPACPV